MTDARIRENPTVQESAEMLNWLLQRELKEQLGAVRVNSAFIIVGYFIYSQTPGCMHAWPAHNYYQGRNYIEARRGPCLLTLFHAYFFVQAAHTSLNCLPCYKFLVMPLIISVDITNTYRVQFSSCILCCILGSSNSG